MSGFVGSRAKKKQRNIFFTLVFSMLIIFLYLYFPKFESSNVEIIPDDTIIPDPSDNLTSLTSNIEELELSLFQKNQKIKFRDGQIKTLQSEMKRTLTLYDSLILQLNTIKNDSDNEDLISSNNYKSLKEKFTTLNIQNNKNILIIKNLNKKIDNFNNNINLTDDEVERIILDNKKLTKDTKSFFTKNIKLENVIKNLKKNINELNNDINIQLEEIKNLKDRSPHGS